MNKGNSRHVIAGVSALAVAAGFAVTAGIGMASAGPGQVSWVDGNSNYTRTISNVTPVEGEVITVSTQFKRAAGKGDEQVTAMKDVHPTCLTFVGLKIDGTPTPLTNSDPTFARVVGNWWVTPNQPRTMEYSYKVGADCARGVPLNTYMDYSGNLGQGNYLNKGPTISVTKNVSTTALDAVPAGVKVGQSVPVSATVTGGADGNIVEFYDGMTKIGQGALAAGKTTVAWTPSTAGTHSLTAKFLGTAKAAESVSAEQNVPVAAASDVATITVVTVPATATKDSAVDLVATVFPAPTGGTVQFMDGGTAIGAPVDVVAGKATLPYAFSVAGDHAITAVYSGAPGHMGSTAAVGTVTVSEAGGGDTGSAGGSLGNLFGSS